MRRSEREITSRDEIDAILDDCDVCRLAFAVSGQPYLVPVSFGYDGKSLYFHSAASGRKIDCLAASDQVCFEVERNVRIIPHADKACMWSLSFESVIGIGTAHELRSPEEKVVGLNAIMEHYSGRTWEFDSANLDATSVWKIVITSISGKRAGPKVE